MFTKTAFQGNPDLKLSCIHGMKQLLEAKMLDQDHAWELRTYIEAVQTPVILAELIRSIYIKLPKDKAQLWAIEHLQAIPVGADLSNSWLQIINWIVNDQQYGLADLFTHHEIASLYAAILDQLDQQHEAMQSGELKRHCDMLLNRFDNDPNFAPIDYNLIFIARAILQQNTFEFITQLQSLELATGEDYLKHLSEQLLDIFKHAFVNSMI